MKILLSWKKEEILDKKDIRCIIVGGAKLVLPIYYITLMEEDYEIFKAVFTYSMYHICWQNLSNMFCRCQFRQVFTVW